jgi:hypothetical protein
MSRQQKNIWFEKAQDYIEAEGTWEAIPSAPIGSIKEPRWTNRRQEKSD